MQIIKAKLYFKKRKKKKKKTGNDVSTVGESKLANKEPTNNEDSQNIKSSVYNKYNNIFNKEKSSKEIWKNDEKNDNGNYRSI